MFIQLDVPLNVKLYALGIYNRNFQNNIKGYIILKDKNFQNNIEGYIILYMIHTIYNTDILHL